MKQFFGAAHSNVAAANRKIIDIAQRNLNSGFDLARSLAGARNPLEFVELLASYYWKQVHEFATQVEVVRYQLFGSSAAEPRAREPSYESTSQERPQHSMGAEGNLNSAGKDIERTVFSAEGASSRTLVPNQRQRRSRNKDTAEKRPKTQAPKTKLKTHSSSSPDIRPGGRPDREGQSQTKRKVASKKSGPQDPSADIKFGILDGNAVRFTNGEAWCLVGGAWRPISSAEALSNAAEMREARFNQRFPQAPLLPSKAFRSRKR
jgi:Phasin protein